MSARELAKSLDLPLIRVGVNPAITLVPAGAQRVATKAPAVMVQTLMGVAA